MADDDLLTDLEAGAHIKPNYIPKEGDVRVVIAPDVGHSAVLSELAERPKERAVGLKDSAHKPGLAEVDRISGNHEVCTLFIDLLDQGNEWLILPLKGVRSGAIS
jgi:hypothetical protein